MKKCLGILAGTSFLGLFLVACSAEPHYAPVTEANVWSLPSSPKQQRPSQENSTLAMKPKAHATLAKSKKEQKKIKTLPIQYSFLGKWRWPAQGKLVQTFSLMNKGIDIKGELHDAIFAAESGEVIYCGNGLPGYGNLIILKHNNLYISAYAHAERVIVKEGEWVKRGQMIAKMGKTGTNSVKLHFEIRRADKPVNPLLYLKMI